MVPGVISKLIPAILFRIVENILRKTGFVRQFGLDEAFFGDLLQANSMRFRRDRRYQ